MEKKKKKKKNIKILKINKILFNIKINFYSPKFNHFFLLLLLLFSIKLFIFFESL